MGLNFRGSLRYHTVIHAKFHVRKTKSIKYFPSEAVPQRNKRDLYLEYSLYCIKISPNETIMWPWCTDNYIIFTKERNPLSPMTQKFVMFLSNDISARHQSWTGGTLLAHSSLYYGFVCFLCLQCMCSILVMSVLNSVCVCFVIRSFRILFHVSVW